MEPRAKLSTLRRLTERKTLLSIPMMLRNKSDGVALETLLGMDTTNLSLMLTVILQLTLIARLFILSDNQHIKNGYARGISRRILMMGIRK
jgi:hypothetical protein